MAPPTQGTRSRNSSTALFGRAPMVPSPDLQATNFMKPAGYATTAIRLIIAATGLKPRALNPETTAPGLPNS